MVEEGGRLGVDIGGTFTDVALEAVGRRYSAKILTTPEAPERAVLEAIAKVLQEAALAPADLSIIIHGTTLATNAIIERKGARTALLTTEGFRDTIEIRHENRFEQYDVNIDLPPPLVPRRLRFPVRERIDARGRVLVPLDEAALAPIIARLAIERVEAVAVGFLHSFTNPAHERRVGEILAERLPDVAVTLSSDVSPEMREYERLSTACANAYVQPLIGRYLADLETMLRREGFVCPLFLMLSGGGLTAVETAIRFPVRLGESGPAGGAIFAAEIARQCKLDKVLSYDMGGTTAKICLIDELKPQTNRAFEVARIYRFKKGSGLPLRIPVSEIVDENMANAARVHAIESGKDARGRTLVAFGGAAPLHAARMAEKLGLDRVLVPSYAGVGSAVGFLRAPIAYEIVRSALQRLDAFDAAAANLLLAAMREEAEPIVRRGAGDAALTEIRSAFMRYRGQGHEIAVLLPARTYGAGDAAGLRAAFEDAYQHLYSRVIPGVEVEILSWVLRLSAPSPAEAATVPPSPVPHTPQAARHRPVFDPELGEFVEVAIHDRAALSPGARIPGPAVIVEDETSTVVTRLFDATIDAFGYIELTRRTS